MNFPALIETDSMSNNQPLTEKNNFAQYFPQSIPSMAKIKREEHAR